MGVSVVAGPQRLVPPITVATFVAVADQLTKTAVTAAIGPGQLDSTVRIYGSAVQLDYVENRGAAFGVLPGQGFLLSLLGLVILAGLIIYYARLKFVSPWLIASVGLIAGGSVGNLIDRVRLGHVVDFIAIGPWPKFNVADSAITVGVALLAGCLLVSDRTHAQGRSVVTPRAQSPARSAEGPWPQR